MEISPNFTPKVQKIIRNAKELALSLNYSEVTSFHLLLELLKFNDLLIISFLQSVGVKLDYLISFTNSFFLLQKQPEPKSKEPKYSKELNSMLAFCNEFAKTIGHDYVNIDHIFFCFLNSKEGAIYHFLNKQGIDPRKSAEQFLISMKSRDIAMNNEISSFLKSGPHQDVSTNDDKMLHSFCTNLSQECKSNKIQKIIGKSFELSRICEILARKNKSNPILLGEPGVGKTAIVEGLAYNIFNRDVPDFLIDQEIYSVDLAAMVAGTKYRGQFEQRVKSLINECKENPNIILFIDEAHTLVGTGSAEGAMDAANILKPALARNQIKLIAATTLSEYKRSFEKDAALVRRFEPILVTEPGADECLEIIKGIKKHYEEFHGIKYNNNVIKKIIELCDLYLPNQNFPDKAIDVLDECGARVKIINSTPTEELKAVEDELYDCFTLNNCDEEKESELLNSYDELAKKSDSRIKRNPNVNDVLHVISKKSKIPLDNLSKTKSERSSKLFNLLSLDVVNQDEAVSCISKSILRSQIGLKDIDKPIGSFLFLGASGVGKTWTAKMLAKNYFGSDKKIIRFNMSEYSDKISANKLIGSPPGYIGYEQGGLLTERIKIEPHSVILFDEIEKADPSVHQLLLQVMDEGILQDNNGFNFHFKDSIIILTSNIGSDLTTKSSLGFSSEPSDNRPKIVSSAKKILSPELINRLDDIIVFNHLGEESLNKIFKHELLFIKERLLSKKIKLKYSPEVSNYICELASKEKMGARPLKRLIKQYIEDPIVEYYFKSEIQNNLRFSFYLLNNKIEFDLL